MQHDGLKKVVDGARVRESASDVKWMAVEARVEAANHRRESYNYYHE